MNEDLDTTPESTEPAQPGWRQRLSRMGRATSVMFRRGASNSARTLHSSRTVLLVTAFAVGSAWVLWKNPPLASIEHGEVGVRSNRLTGGTTELHEGSPLL
jgi:hypothetical protein